MTEPPRAPSPGRTQSTRRFWVGAAMVSLAAAWLAGAAMSGTDVTPLLEKAWPAADRFEPVSKQVYAAYAASARVGHVAIGEADGYGGPLRIAVGIDDAGTIVGTIVVEHKETPSYFARVARRGYPDRLTGKRYADPFTPGDDLDAVTGATYTVDALAAAALEASRLVAGGQLGLPVRAIEPPPVRFGLPEIALLLLYAAGLVGRRRGFRHRALLRWAMLLTGLVVFGFWLNAPLTLSRISSLLLGYWPDWRTDLYWYLLVGGILFVATVDNKNAYCAWFCPFGAAQECMGVIGGATVSVPRAVRRWLSWMHWGLAWLALVLALLFRNPGISSYEVFGTLFSFTGSRVMVALLAIVLVTSLFVRRPWCRFLCPLEPVYDVIRVARNLVSEQWQKARPRTAASSR